jgi:hypothetical protein
MKEPSPMDKVVALREWVSKRAVVGRRRFI